MGALSYLLDTHALLWWLFDDRSLSRKVRAVLKDPDHRIVVSSASAWEVATKHRLGRLDSATTLIHDFPGWMSKAGFSDLQMSSAHAVLAGSWNIDHKDPFDRMLAAQSRIERLPLITRDPVFEDFGLDTVW